MKTSTTAPMELLLMDSRGVYIPQHFVTDFMIGDEGWRNISDSDKACCERGPEPENEWYWEAWQQICDDASHTDEHGNEWRLYQDGDLWAVRADAEWNDDEGTFVLPEEDNDG